MNRRHWPVVLLVVLAILVTGCAPQPAPSATAPQSNTTAQQSSAPTAQPVEPTAKPVEPTAKPVEPTAEPAEPTAQPSEPTSVPAAAADAKTSLTVMNPQGPAAVVKELAPRLASLSGKKVALWLSATADELYAGKGAEYYDKLASLLKQQVPDVEIISYDKMPRKYSPADEVIKGITDQKPDAVVVALGG